MKGQISAEEKSRRLHILEKISKESSAIVLNNAISSSPIKTVLFETFDGTFAYGHTDNFLEVAVSSTRDLKSELLTVKLSYTNGNVCFGNLIDDNI